MKKSLFGLVALSALSFSAIDLGTVGGNVFQTGGEGKVAITGTVTSNIPVVKYVAYVSADGTFSPEKETLNLPDFIISGNKLSDVGFVSTPEKIYVKRVNGNNDNVTDLVNEEIAVKLAPTPGWNFRTPVLTWSKNDYWTFSPFYFIPKQELLDKFTGELLAGATIQNETEAGVSILLPSGNVYKPTCLAGYYFRNSSDGVIEFKSINATSVESTATEAELAAVDTVFAGGISFANGMAVLVKVESK